MLNKIKQKTNLSITTLLIIGILVVINFFSYNLFARIDITENNIFSISNVSKKTAAELTDVINIKAYFSDNLPYQFAHIKKETEDILNEYESYAKGNIKAEFVSPETDEETFRDLALMGIYPVSFQVLEKDKAQSGQGYLAMVISYGTKKEVIPVISEDTSSLEYQITSAIKKATSDRTITVGFLTGHGEKKPDENLRYVSQELSQLYDVVEVEIEDSKLTIPVDTLIVAGPTEIFEEEEFKAINSFLEKGGSLLALMDGIVIDVQGLMARGNETNFNDLLNMYGVSVNKDLVGDVRMGTIQYTQGNTPFAIIANYPLWPKVMKDTMNNDFGAVAGLESLIFPWVSSVQVDETKLNADNYTYFLSTTEKAFRQTDQFNAAPNIGLGMPEGKLNLAVAVNSGLQKAFTSDEEENKNIPGRLAVIGDSDFIADNFLADNPENLILFSNLVDNMSLGSDLAGIRAKQVQSRPINNGEELSDARRNAIRYLNVFGVTVVIVAFGLFRYFMRKRSRFADDL